jgi:hypothetical protein
MKREYSNFDEVLSKAPGPNPMQLNIIDLDLHSKYGDLVLSQYSETKLLLATEKREILAIFDYGCYVKKLEASMFLAWFQEYKQLGESKDAGRQIQLVIADVNKMEIIKNVKDALMEMNFPFFQIGGEVGRLQIPLNLSVGRNKFDFPEEFKQIEELLLIAQADSEVGWILALYSIRPKENIINVIPQEWYKEMDAGYQWPTRVARDPVTDRIFMEGNRIGKFVLDESGRQIDKWILFDSFYSPER